MYFKPKTTMYVAIIQLASGVSYSREVQQEEILVKFIVMQVWYKSEKFDEAI